MEKDFTDWHGIKQRIEASNQRWFCHEREVRWCSIGLNVGSEIDGKGIGYTRPVLIIKKLTKNTCLCLPLTTREKHGGYYMAISLRDNLLRFAVLSQIRLIDTKRLRDLVGVLDKIQFLKIKRALIDILA